MKHLQYLLISCVWMFVLSSCQKAFNTVVDLNIPHTPLITLNSSNGMSFDSVLLLVRGTKGISDTGYCPIIPNASVSLWEDGVEIRQLSYRPDREMYVNGFHNFISGKTYQLRVSAPGYADVVAEDKMPNAPKNCSYTLKRNARQMNLEQNAMMWYDELTLNFEDDGSQENYYSLRFAYQLLDLIEFGNDVFSFGLTVYSNDPDLEQEDSDPLNPQSGLFRSKVYFGDKNFNGKKKQLIFYLPNGNASPDPMPSTMVFYFAFENLSENAYKYERTNQLYWQSEGNPFSEPVQIHQNVKNGVGNFRLKYRLIDSLYN